jgi:signal peptidase II
VLFLSIALLIATIDQYTKAWIRSNLALGQSLFEVGFFRLIHVRNTGAAFGLFQGQAFPLTVISLVGIAILIAYTIFIYRIHRHSPFLNYKLCKSALCLILGGTVGNLIDRLRFGYVTDFINFNLWPAFNIADLAVTIGVILFAYSLFSITRTTKY